MEELKEGIKIDGDKLPWDLLPYDALVEVVKVLQCGAKKYEPRNWEKGINFSRIYSAIKRHLDGDGHASIGWFQGEDNDLETGLNHLAHVICECLFALAYTKRGMVSFDNRPVLNKQKENSALVEKSQ